MCDGNGEITWDIEIVTGKTIYHWTDLDGRVREQEVETKTLVGGTDACPRCAEAAEREWKIHNEIY